MAQSQISAFQQFVPQAHVAPAAREEIFRDKNDWACQKSKHDLQLMNQYIQPLPLFPKRQGSDKTDFKSLTEKMLNLTNMINLMLAC